MRLDAPEVQAENDEGERTPAAPEVQAENDEGERTPAFVFDFREASEHYVKASPRNSFQSGHAPGPQAGGSTVVQHPSGFNMPRNYTARM